MDGCCKVILKKGKLVALINYSEQKNAQFIFQCERGDSDKESTKNGFSIKDRYYLKIYSTFISVQLNTIIAKYYAQRSLTRSLGILETFQQITHEKNFANIF